MFTYKNMMNDIETPFLSDNINEYVIERDDTFVKRTIKVCEYMMYFFTFLLLILTVLELYGVSNGVFVIISKITVLSTLIVLLIFILLINVRI